MLTMTTTRKKDFSPHISADDAPPCEAEGCPERGVYKAPKARDKLHEYCWFCLDHVREHNKQWDYFDGMERDEIEEFMKEAVTGHRPTWAREDAFKTPHARLYQALEEFLNLSPKRAAQTSPALPEKLRKALATLDMPHPYTLKELKIQYRVLVKKFHPDVNKGSKQHEEKFKQITASYQYLLDELTK
ncbi:MAG: molecular chaperone DnaJ [Alphaproteobacteria bacterium]|nr:molecular chaperone DnaJ [Alphaproteobacteria bacterium]